jgi:hypothetical protein
MMLPPELGGSREVGMLADDGTDRGLAEAITSLALEHLHNALAKQTAPTKRQTLAKLISEQNAILLLIRGGAKQLETTSR